MAKIKINAIGFGYDKNIKLSENLIILGTAMIIGGLIINHSKTLWWVGKDIKTVDNIVALYDHIK